jgi:ATP-binding protein involved in chromosome partitioning
MKVAVPTAEGVLCMHFGHCEVFTIVTADDDTRTVSGTEALAPPAHEPGVLPKWLHEQGVDTVIAGGMGMRAQQLFTQHGVNVVVGAPSAEPVAVVRQWLRGELVTGGNVCDH